MSATKVMFSTSRLPSDVFDLESRVVLVAMWVWCALAAGTGCWGRRAARADGRAIFIVLDGIYSRIRQSAPASLATNSARRDARHDLQRGDKHAQKPEPLNGHIIAFRTSHRGARAGASHVREPDDRATRDTRARRLPDWSHCSAARVSRLASNAYDTT